MHFVELTTAESTETGETIKSWTSQWVAYTTYEGRLLEVKGILDLQKKEYRSCVTRTYTKRLLSVIIS
jgi:hypothetical protein